MSFFTNPQRIPENYGIKIAGGLILFFVAMYVAGLSHVVELRFFNLLILGVGVYFGLKKFKLTHGKHMNYFRALITGVAMSAIGSVLFALFIFAWMQFDPAFLKWLLENEPMGRHLNAYMLAFIVALENLFIGMLVTFVLLNWITTDEVSES